MAFYELDAPRRTVADGLLARIGHKLHSFLRTMQYGRMMQVMSQFSDENLKSLGITRSDIPRYARELIYSEQE